MIAEKVELLVNQGFSPEPLRGNDLATFSHYSINNRYLIRKIR